MATRRSRIKGIANIPQRRKVESKSNEDLNLFLKPEPKTKEVNSSIDAAESSSTTPLEETSVQAEVQDDISNNDSKIESASQPTTCANPQTDLPRRRNTIKPLVNQRLFQRPKLKIDNLNQSNNKEDVKNATNTSSELETAPTAANNNLPIQDLNQNRNSSIDELSNTHSTSNAHNFQTGSDTECSLGPLSPTKVINRSRIKAVPRLSHRRTSMTVHGSASESEDDSKRNYKRIRTESACSSISITNEPQIQTDVSSPQKSKEFSSIIQRKCKRTEQSRKMAEARRHFMHKFGNQIPDKQKLTMMDLIFYNPISNPMSQKPKKQIIEEIENDVEAKEEETQDESIINNESDEENTIPAPQIKIGANGEIVIDEKSLIIENEETKRNREEIQKSKIVDGDFDTGYGIYKREKRSKDWSKEETLRFYKALNTLGTDFTLMVELFSGRSRRELKMKFKKEERVNRPLIDKALTQPVRFDITELRKEAEEQLFIEQQRERQNSESRSKKDVIPYIGKTKKTSSSTTSKKQKSKSPKQKSPDLYTTLEKGISSLCQTDTEDEDDTEEQMNETVSDATTKPTRSGRVPKRRKLYTPEELPIVAKKTLKDTCPSEKEKNDLNNISALQPGSIMIVASQTPSGDPTFKVFMVTPSQNKVPITLTPDMLNNLTQVQNAENSINGTVSLLENHINETSLNDTHMTVPAEEMVVSTEAIEEEMWPPYEQSNISIPMDENIILPEDKNITLCSDGKYDVQLPECSSEEVILPD
ncbi:hypothetical protein ILUMI_26835 [Ignelater luminosus]|uniref:Myb-like domain-containing protein n=1 Tax=Ignelater luminosus TaxID=2038154 RepID=A0A8K0C415_IGNLU|nr:hypothetical protein ILUMI_26835 [Ignelater luminosus]